MTYYLNNLRSPGGFTSGQGINERTGQPLGGPQQLSGVARPGQAQQSALGGMGGGGVDHFANFNQLYDEDPRLGWQYFQQAGPQAWQQNRGRIMQERFGGGLDNVPDAYNQWVNNSEYGAPMSQAERDRFNGMLGTQPGTMFTGGSIGAPQAGGPDPLSPTRGGGGMGWQQGGAGMGGARGGPSAANWWSDTGTEYGFGGSLGSGAPQGGGGMGWQQGGGMPGVGGSRPQTGGPDPNPYGGNMTTGSSPYNPNTNYNRLLSTTNSTGQQSQSAGPPPAAGAGSVQAQPGGMPAGGPQSPTTMPGQAGMGGIGSPSQTPTQSLGGNGNYQPVQALDLAVNDFLDPSMNFRIQQGTNALESSAAARGGLLSGATLRGVQDYSQNIASQEYSNAVNRAMQDRGYRSDMARDSRNFNYGVDRDDRNYARDVYRDDRNFNFDRDRYNNDFAYRAQVDDRNFNYMRDTGNRNFDYTAQVGDRDYNYRTLSDLARMGLAGSQGQAGLQQTLASILNQNIMAGGNAGAAGAIGGGNAINQMISQLLQQMQQNQFLYGMGQP